jgi:hypothetical protein
MIASVKLKGVFCFAKLCGLQLTLPRKNAWPKSYKKLELQTLHAIALNP